MVQEVRPRNHARKVMTGRDGSSVSGTTNFTSSTGHQPSSPFGFSTSVWFLVIAAIDARKDKEN
ncbi:hypothetical protein SLEP1_g29133 [Rubroshorea leprosula]|uniref:Uncharacterized protein n=1 Tax=Rubroshorea leprosula TaxID=152421 RepID=A0AAV5K4I5_9ROSI|nr:hypothetical protein SLEP1_g29133 [Rubroshorea leprosula]